ncbi:MAG: tetratricopeptide repeat protein, partial [Acidobacteria bacterium]
TYVGMHQVANAFEALERALEMDPHSEVTLQNLASLYLKLGRAQDAAGIYRQARTTNPRNQAILLGLGVAEMARGDLAAARDALQSARQAGPPTIPLHNALAEVYRRFGLAEQAVAELQASLQLDPEQQLVRQQLTRLLGSQGSRR